MTEHTRISGTTRLYAVLGDPVSQVRAPALLNPYFAERGIDAVLVPVHAPAGRLAEVVTGLQGAANLDGLLITVPHKFEVRRFADRLSPTVGLSGSANALRREPGGTWFAENFDGTGFVRGLRHRGHEPRGLRVALVGAGGAGSAVAAALLEAGVDRLSVCDLDRTRREALVNRLAARWPGRVAATGRPELTDADLAVNATDLGLRPEDPLPFDPAGLGPGSLVADIVMKPRETRLLSAAAALGLRVHHGHHMLDQQLPLYAQFFGLEGV